MTTRILYDLPIDGAQFQRRCGGNLTGDNESCAELAAIPGADAFVIRDSKPEGAGRELRFTRDELGGLATLLSEHAITA